MSANAKCSESEFVELFTQHGAAKTAKILKTDTRAVNRRRRRLEHLFGAIASPNQIVIEHPGRVPLEIKNGQVLIGSDFHVWPGEESTCLRAFKKFVDDIKPQAVILNGDVMDFPRISRHPQNWEKAPDPQEEIEAAQDHLNDIVMRTKKGTKKIWTLGNHDARFEAMIANAAPQYRGVKGVHLSDHFATWQKAMSCMINYEVEHGRTMVKHRLHGGQHATYNNVKKAGTHIVTGHLHAQNVRRVSDYRPYDLYGVDAGCVASKKHSAFTYTEDSPLDWGEGFALLTYSDYRLMMPELVTKWDDNSVQWRGKIIKV